MTRVTAINGLGGAFLLLLAEMLGTAGEATADPVGTSAETPPQTSAETSPQTSAETSPQTSPQTSAQASVETSARTSGDAPRLDAGIFVGGNYFSDELELGNAFFPDQVPRSGALIGLRSSYVVLPALAPGSSLDPTLAVEAEMKLAFSSTAGMADAMRPSYFSPVLGWRVLGSLGLLRTRTLRPFIVLGVGGETVFTSSPYARSVDTDATLYWGAGAVYRLAPSYGLRVDFRHGMTAARDEFQSNTLELHAGFYYSFLFGRRASRSTAPDESHGRDTIRMEPTSEPDAATDKDGDGVPDFSDACPKESENKNGIEDDDGCPEMDPDNDGLIGEADACATQAEDFDGHEDQDGCPEPDNDSDGSLDMSDACPQEPEMRNGYDDEDGCPDAIPAPLAGVLGVVRGLRFQGGTAKLLPQSFAALDRVAAALASYPDVRIRVVGHVDERSTSAAAKQRSLRLSEERAGAVKLHLVDKGVEGSRIETLGEGGEKPIASNKTKSGRARNQRVEIELIVEPLAPAPGASTDTPGAADPGKDVPATTPAGSGGSGS